MPAATTQATAEAMTPAMTPIPATTPLTTVSSTLPSPPSPAEIAADVFRYLDPALRMGRRRGGTLLLIAAPGFGGGPAYKCKFAVCAEGELGDDKTAACGGAETTVDASFSDTELLSCYTPELLPSSRVAGKVGAAVDVSISLNGAADFSVHPSSYVVPADHLHGAAADVGGRSVETRC